jgi:putative ABC transport system permease protein
VAFGLVPALRASRVDLDTVLRAADDRATTASHSTKFGAWCAVAEIALALMLLVGSALLLRGFMTLRGVNPGFEASNVLTMRTAVTGPRFASVDATSQVITSGLERVGSMPGVEAAAATLTGAPLSGVMSFLNITVPGRLLDGPYFAGGYLGGWHLITPRYFDALGIPLVAGRRFTEQDQPGAAPVVIINQAMAKQLWPDTSPLGFHLLIGQGAGPDYEETTPRQVVGVVGNVRHVGLQFDARPTAYVPLAQTAGNQMALFNRIGVQLTWIVRTEQDPARAAGAIRTELRRSISGLPLAATQTMDDLSSASTARERFVTSLMTMFAAVTVLLAAIGVFGVMAYGVRLRTREIGIRVALGADTASVRNMVLFQGMRVAITGVVIGTVSALALARLTQGIMFGVKAYDATVFVTMPLILTAVALAAAWLPARRAARVDPIVTLRE